MLSTEFTFRWWEPRVVCLPEPNQHQGAPFLWIYTDSPSRTPCESDPVVEFLRHCTSSVPPLPTATPPTSRTLETCYAFGHIAVSLYQHLPHSPEYGDPTGLAPQQGSV